MTTITAPMNQKVHVKLSGVSKTGKAAKIDGVPAIRVLVGDSTATMDENGRGVTLTAAKTPGDTVYILDANLDPGSGILEEMTDTIVLHVSENPAHLGLAVDSPLPTKEAAAAAGRPFIPVTASSGHRVAAQSETERHSEVERTEAERHKDALKAAKTESERSAENDLHAENERVETERHKAEKAAERK